MNTIDYTFVVDLARPLKTNTLLVMQHDANSRVVHFLLMNDGKRFDCTDVTGVIVTAVTGGGSTIVSSDVEIVQDDDENNTNELVFTLPSDLTATAGRSTLVITLYGENTQISSFEFYVNTRNELYNVGSYSDTDDLSGFRDLLTRALTAVARVENMQSSTEFPNPYPLRLVLDEDADEVYSYNGSETVEVDFEGIVGRIEALETAFPAGCDIIYDAAVAAGITPASRSPQDLAAVFMLLRNGTAAAGDVASGKTFSSTAGVNVTGTLAQLTSSDFSGEASTTTAGAAANYNVKTTAKGIVNSNVTVHALAATTSPTIATTAATGTKVINVTPGFYNKVSVNQTNAYNAGNTAGIASGRANSIFAFGDWTTAHNATATLPAGTYKYCLVITNQANNQYVNIYNNTSDTEIAKAYAGVGTEGYIRDCQAGSFTLSSSASISIHAGCYCGYSLGVVIPSQSTAAY